MKRIFIILFVFIPILFSNASEPFRVMFYNVENLFDCEHDSLKNDYEFLPNSVRAWTPRKYFSKINKTAKVIIAAGADNVPDLVGLCEVENAKTVETLIKYSPLRQAGYRFVMTDSPDERGIDVALLYQRDKFKLLQSNCIRIPNKKTGMRPTRDILHVLGVTKNRDSLDLFVYHAPSRAGGAKISEKNRVLTATVLKNNVDSIIIHRVHPNIIIMGDFNDYPTNIAIVSTLGATKPGKEFFPYKLYNLMAGKSPGTYRYKGEWGVLDQFIVLGRMLDVNNGISTSYEDAHIGRFSFLMEEDHKYGGETPSRTYIGRRYHDGYSDHLPVYVDFVIRDDKGRY